METKELSRMLFVDDRTKRITYAIDVLSKKYDISIATCVPEALRELSSGKYGEGDFVSLDHDLNGHDFQDPDDSTSGMEIVRYIEKCGGWFDSIEKPTFIIHSTNRFAANMMIKRLDAMKFFTLYVPVNYSETP